MCFLIVADTSKSCQIVLNIRKYKTDPTLQPSESPVKFTGTTDIIVDVTACDEWDYESVSNSMQIKLSGILDVTTSNIYVNQYSGLPINGNTETFDIEYISENKINYLSSIHVTINDAMGYCIKQVSVTLNNEIYTFDQQTHFGENGLVLSSDCDYSYKFINNQLSLNKCIQGQLVLKN